ncbi:MAG: IS3 family transposase [Spirochaetaceae bacterium]|nr:IS3 family transposase [Spirochaetaceae bacterium]
MSGGGTGTACVEEHHCRYGRRRIQAGLRERYGLRASHKRLAKLPRKYGLNARGRRKFIPAADSGRRLAVCENLLNRDFHAAGPGEKRVAGSACLRAAGGRPYLTAALDLYDRKITGRAFGGTTGAEETAAGALETAVGNRKPRPSPLFHSGRGGTVLPSPVPGNLEGRRHQARQSVSRKGNCRDNARAERFFRTLQRELEILDGRQPAAAVRASVFQYIGAYRNRIRRHSALDCLGPVMVTLKKVA